MPNFTKYEPYPNSNFGAGDFTDDQGRTMPLYDPVEAQRLTQPPPEDLRTAQNDAVEPPPEGAYARDFAAGTGGGATAKTAPASTTATKETKKETRTLEDAEMEALGTTAHNIGVHPNDLYDTFNRESKMDPTARNPKTHAGGIFQIMPDQEKALLAGTGYDDITKMSRAEQINLYPKYLEMHNAHPKTKGDLALAQGAPAAIGAPPGQVIYAPGSKEALANPSWVDKTTGAVTAGSLQAAFGANVNMDDPVARAGAQLYAPMAGTPGMSQQSTTSSVHQGTPYTQEQQDQVRALHGGVNAADDAAMAPVIEAQKQIQLQQIEVAKEIKTAKDKAATTEALSRTNYEAGQARVQAGVDAVEQDKQPPPFTQRNIFAGILAAIAQGMGTYSAAINHTENFAMKAINEAIAQDNQRWQQQHLDKQFKVKEAKDLNANQWHVFQSDKAEREMQQRKLLDNELEQRMSLAKGADQQRVLGLNKADNLKHYGELDLQLKRAAAGTASTSVTNAYVGPTEGGAPDLETVNKRVQVGIEAGEDPEVFAAARRQHGETGKVPVLQKTREAYVQGSGVGKPGIRDIEQSERGLLEAGQAYGFDYDPKTHQFTAAPGTPDRVARSPLSGEALSPNWAGATDFGKKFVPDALGKRLSGGEDPEARKAAYLTASDAATHTIKTIYGRTNEKEIDLQRQQFFGQSQDSLLENMNRYMRDTQSKREELNASFPGAEADYNRRNPKDATKDEAPIKETPVK